jgi:diaminopimelate decarboxylase
VAEVGGLLDLVHRHRDVVQLMGLSFHLDTADVLTKALAAQECLDVMAQAWRIGLTPSVLDIGGGFRQQFVEDPTAFDAYLADLKAGLMGRGPSLTWDGAGLGFRVENGAVLGTPVSHKYGVAASGLGTLTELLATPLPGHHGRSLSRVLRDNMLEVWLEPGKALLDHAGLTLAQVEFVKTTADDLTLVNLNISRDHVCPVDQEILMDPIVVPMDGANLATDIADEPAPASGPVGVYFAGRLCLERDMVTQHQVRLDSIPEPGDTVAFVNTAAYNMDLSASSAGLHAMPVKVVLAQAANGTFSAAPDGGTTGEVLTWPSPATSPS